MLTVQCALLLSGVFSVCVAQSVMVEWNPSPTTNVVGYDIYFGILNGIYTNELQVGKTTNLVIPGLLNGIKYYFAATAVNSSGIQSSLSGQTSYTVPVAAAELGSPNYSNSKLSFTVTGTAGYNYAIQTSSNLLNWTSLQTNTSPWTFTDTNTKSFHQRFYRAIYPP
jgi:hypothetical protein